MADMCFKSTPVISANQRCCFSCRLSEREPRAFTFQLQKVVHVISTLESPQSLTQTVVTMRHIIYNPLQIIYRKHNCLYSYRRMTNWLEVGNDKQYVIMFLEGLFLSA